MSSLRAARWLATGFGTGYAPYAPGTAGTLLAVPIYLAAASLPVAYYLALVAGMYLLGVRACDQVARAAGARDPQFIVWDEVVGFLVAMTAAPTGWAWIAAGFVLFRAFDILKPWPVGWLDRHVGGGAGIMADDAAAGIYALVLLQACAWWIRA